MAVMLNQVRCLVKGEQVLRFMNLCRKNGIEMRHLVHEEDGIQIEIEAKNFKKLRPLVRKTHVKIHILNRQGPAFFFYRHKGRWWFLIGAVLCAAMIYGLSLFVWQIDVSGNSKYTDALILQTLEQMDVKTGCRKSQIDLSAIEKNLRLKYNQIIWVSARMTGTKLQIELREGELKVANEAEEVLPSDLTANADAVITSVVVRRGTAAVQKGDIVQKGDVLIEGKVYIYNEDTSLKKVDYLQADGDIFGGYQQNYEKIYQRKHEVRKYSNRKTYISGVKIGDRNFRWPAGQNIFMKDKEADQAEIWSWQKRFRLTPTFYLPLALDYTEYVPYRKVMEDYSDDALNAMAEDDLQNYLNELKKKGVQIITNSVTISLDAGGGHAEGILTLDGPIGEMVPIRSDQMAWVQQNE